ncbi:HEAT repeat domain-containing protein [Halosimplex pelagicum]|uniref:HEAT repeat domain-containing protein n=1 Tax=Halosimplex pelagicum TaxID=869886 RepID=A0A7D5PGD4_9EURY|nr:HEAT repeat domain-containing protein [Halosimplex pelagicum]QLH83759.1 HEAT repeat domain-containing protein [Halosimplex pelagicum]
MTEESPRHLRAALATGRSTPDDVIDRALDHLDAEADPVREHALRTLVAATETRPERVIDVVDTVDSSLRPGRAVTAEELVALRDLARHRPRALSPLVDSLGTALSNPDESEVRPALAAALLGDIGGAAPGVVKPALGPLVGLTESSVTDTAVEAAWAVTRTAVNEPAMLRPVIAGRVWDLDSDDPATIISALGTLGRIGWFLPEHLAGLDEIAAHVDHPVSDVRAAAIRALGRIADIQQTATLGIPHPDRVEPYLDRIVARLADPDSEVRCAAAIALKQVARQDPSAVREYRDDLLRMTDDDDWEVRLATLKALEYTFDAGTFDLHRLQERVLPCLADGDGDVEGAAISLLLTVVEEIRTDAPGIASHLIDLLLWAQFTSQGLFETKDPLHELEDCGITLPDIPRYVELAQTLSELGGFADQQTTAKLCGVIARQSPDHGLAAIRILQSLLADDGEAARRQVLEEFKSFIQADPAVAPMLWQITASVYKYDPVLRDEAARVLTVSDTEDPSFLADIIDLQRRFLQDEMEDDDESEDEDEDGDGDLGVLFGSEPSGGSLEPFIDSSPQLVTDAALTLLSSFPAEHDSTEYSAELLAQAVSDGGTIDLETAETLEETIRAEDTSPTVVAWLSTALLLATEDTEIRDRAIDRLHSFAERHEDTPILACLRLLADDTPRFAARILVNHPPIAILPEMNAETLAEIITAHPRLYLHCRGRESPFSAHPIAPGYANDAKWLGELSETIPQTVPATQWIQEEFWSDDGELTASLLEAIGRGAAMAGDDGFEIWAAYPHSDVRRVTTHLDEDHAEPSASSPAHLEGPENATREQVDEIATHLSATDPDRCQRAAELLVTIGAHNPDLRSYVRQHLLTTTVALDEVAAPDSLLGALATLAPKATGSSTSEFRSTPADPLVRDTPSPVIQQYARFGTPSVREVALCTLRSLPAETVGSPAEDVLIERLRDPDAIVRAQAARTVGHFAGNGLKVTTPLVDAVVDGLDGPRHVTIACCEAVGHCGAADPTSTDRAVSELEIRLRARERGVRRAAATALARISDVEPDSLIPITDTLIERFCEDQVAQGELLPAISTLPIDETPKHDRVAETALTVLMESDRPSVSQAAGRLLTAIVDDSPGSVRMHLDAVSDRLEDQYDDAIISDLADVGVTPLSLYWLLRVIGTCTRENPRIADRFDWLISEAIDYMDGSASDGIATYGVYSDDHVTARALARVTARVAALGGLDCYNTVLEHWPEDPTKPDLEPAETAHHLTITDEASRTNTLKTFVENASQARVDSVIGELLDHGITLNRNEAIFDSLEELLPLTENKRLHRRGVSKLLETSRDGNWEIRTNAVETLARLGATSVVPADEVIAHFFSFFNDRTPAQESVAGSIMDLLQHSELSPELVFRSAVIQYEGSPNSPNVRKTGICLVAKLGIRYSSVRERAVNLLMSSIEDKNQWVRQQSADGLVELKRRGSDW